MERNEEHALIREAIAGDRDAMGELIRNYQPSLNAYMLRLSGRPDVAEDICHEAFVRVMTNLHRFDFRYRFSTWLFTIARRLYVNAMQKMKPAFDTDTVSAWRGKDDKPHETTGHAETMGTVRDALQDALMELTEEQRSVLVLFHQLDWPIAVIAEHMGMPEGTIKSHLHRGRRKLRTLLEQDEATLAACEEAWA